MVGTDMDHAFNGTFDGDGHTITATLNSSAAYCAPFAFTYGATIKNLHTTGTINTSNSNAGGVVGRNGTASLTLTNVSCDMTINSSKSGNASHGGLMGYAINATVSGCAFTGRLLGESSSRFGGMLGWKSNTDNSLKASAASITLTVSDAVPVTVSATNDLLGTDVPMAAPDNCYVLSGHSSDNTTTGVGFYQYTGTLKAHRAYAVFGGYGAPPKMMRFVFGQEQAPTGTESVSEAASGSVRKVMVNGQLFIEKNGVRLDVTGKQVR